MSFKRIGLSLCMIIGLVLPFAYSTVQAAESVDPFKEVCKGVPQGPDAPPVCKERDLKGKNPLFGPDGILTKVINLLSIVVGIVAIIGILEAGLKFITSGSDSQAISSARNRVLYACIALVIAAFAQTLVRFILFKIE